MSFTKLERFERERKAAEEAEREEAARKALKREVREALPKHLTKPKRPKGRPATGGLTRKEVRALKAQAKAYLEGESGLRELEGAVQHTALVILLIDGVLGTEPWRAAHGPHGGIIAANARLRYLENATRILEDLRKRNGSAGPKLLEGVIDVEPVRS